MRRAKGGWKASYKDTWSLDCALNPIIAAGLKKFLEVKAEKDMFGVPGVIANKYPEGDIDEADKEWQEVLEKMLYAFDTPEPDIRAYDFKLDMQLIKDDTLPEGSRRCEFLCSNEEEYARYKADLAVHEEKVVEGHRLFGEYYRYLWW